MKSFIEYKDEKKKILLEKDKFKNRGATPDPKIWKLWRSLINMSKKELEEFYESDEGKGAGMSKKEADAAGVRTGRESKWTSPQRMTRVRKTPPNRTR
jgi:hypothetical protein